jgi:dihydrodiol dehydrogenase / D-xylose 1-dehydrogenase (NADP)
VEAIAARSLESAQEFAKLHRIPKAYGSYEELAKDANIEVVYIGAIHPYHFSVAKLMLQNRKHVLVEKPMTLNLKCTQQLISLAREKQLFIMEALWSRFLPSYEFVMKTIRNGVIGDVFHVSAELGKNNAHIDRVSKKALGGGTLLNFGIYAINIIEMVFKNEIPEKISSIAHLNDEGVDESVCAALQFSGGKTAVFSTHSRVQFTNEAHIVGTKGIIKV